MNKVVFNVLAFIIVCSSFLSAQTLRTRTYTPVEIDSVKVYKNGRTLDKLSFTTCNARLIRNMDEFTALEKPLMNQYGSDMSRQYAATGFYRTEKINGRWWIIDPEGYPQINRYVCGVRPGKSDRNKAAFATKFGNNNIWMAQLCNTFEDLGFNGFSGWSEQDLVISNNKQTDAQMAVTLVLDMMSSFKPRVNNVAPVFDPEFPAYADQQAKKLCLPYKDEKNFFGYFSDNELPFRWWSNLDDYLAIDNSDDPNRLAAEKWLINRGKTKNQITTTDRMDFVEYLVSTYYSIVTSAIRKYDPNHMILGSRLNSYNKYVPGILKAHNAYCNICSINNYETWEQSDEQLKIWEDNLDIPFIASEFYAKAEDSGLPNKDGAGNWVKTQEDRGAFYQTFCLKLLESKLCVGWHWFRYLDNDPEYKYNQYFDTDANKGLFNNDYVLYEPLAEYMKELNRNVYRLIDYFDRTYESSDHVSLEPEEDTFVARSAADTLLRGNTKRLATCFSADNNYLYESLLKFNLTNFKATISDYEKIVLKLYAGRGNSKTIEIHGVQDISWDEGSLTGKKYVENAPLSADNLIASFTVSPQTNRYYDVDVTDFVKSSLSNPNIKHLTFRLSDRNPQSGAAMTTEFYSKEAEINRPALYLKASNKPDVNISSLKINNLEYDAFTERQHDYEVKLPYTTTGIPQIAATVSGGVAVVTQATSLTGTVGERTATIVIYDNASNPQLIKKYKFTFEVLPKLDLFLMIGQSNMAGRGQLDDAYYYTNQEKVFILNDENTFEYAMNPLNGYSNIRKNYAIQGLGPAYTFARKYQELNKKKAAIGLIVNARGGSSMEQWQKGNNAGLYAKTMLRVKEAQKWGDVKAILWHQGESDLKNNSYLTQLKSMIDSLRKDLGAEVLFVAGQLAQWMSGTSVFNQNLTNIGSVTNNAGWINSVGLSPLINSSDPHFDAGSQIELGERYAQEVFRFLNPNTNFEFIANYEFNNGDDVSQNPIGLTFTTFTAAGVTKNTTFTYFSTKGWTDNEIYDPQQYMTFTLEPRKNYSFNLVEISFDIYTYSDKGPGFWEISSSQDKYRKKLKGGNISTEKTKYKIVLNKKFKNLKVPITFRIYTFGSKTKVSTLMIDNVEIRGTTASVVK